MNRIIPSVLALGFAMIAGVAEWQEDVTAVPIPSEQAQGMVHGVKFQVEAPV